MAGADRPQPVAWLARDLGAYRQNVQRIVNDLHREGLVTAMEASLSVGTCVKTLLGHASSDTTERHYIMAQSRIAERALARAIGNWEKDQRVS
jgi:hypothetical protein